MVYRSNSGFIAQSGDLSLKLATLSLKHVSVASLLGEKYWLK